MCRYDEQSKRLKLKSSALQFITHFTERYSYVDSARIALEGGCRWVQLRMKEASDDEFVAVARQVRELCCSYGATFIIDDRVHLVKEVGADGVHLGLNDMPISASRQFLGPSCIIGGTANRLEDAIAHIGAGADYIGCGPFRYTTTKKNLSPVLGLEGYISIVEGINSYLGKIQSSCTGSGRLFSSCEGSSVCRFPIVAIGGISLTDIPQILVTGVNGIALSGSVLNAEDPILEMRKIVAEIAATGGHDLYAVGK